MTSCNGFVHKYGLKNEAAWNIKVYKAVSFIGLNNVDIYLKDGPFSSDAGNGNLNPTKGLHWVAFINEIFFDSYACAPPEGISIFIKNRNGHCLYSEYKI